MKRHSSATGDWHPDLVPQPRLQNLIAAIDQAEVKAET
jgi:hypothetical protein